MDVLQAVLQAIAVLVSIAALVLSRVSRGRRLAERAETSLRLATNLAGVPNGGYQKGLGGVDTAQALISELADDARINTARYLQSGKGLGIRSLLIALGAVYCILFVVMGSIEIAESTTTSQWLGALVILILGVVSGVLAIVGVVNRELEHKALRVAGLPITTTWSEIKQVRTLIGNRRVIRRRRRAG